MLKIRSIREIYLIVILKMIAKFKSLQNHQGFMKYFKNTSWLFGEKILRMVVGLFVGIWVARYLGPEQFGLFSYSQSFVGLFIAIATLGLDGIVVRELVKDENRRDDLEKIPVKYPIKPEQQTKIVKQIEKQFSIIDKLEQTVNKSLNKTEQLRKSILKSAFEGKLK